MKRSHKQRSFPICCSKPKGNTWCVRRDSRLRDGETCCVVSPLTSEGQGVKLKSVKKNLKPFEPSFRTREAQQCPTWHLSWKSFLPYISNLFSFTISYFQNFPLVHWSSNKNNVLPTKEIFNLITFRQIVKPNSIDYSKAFWCNKYGT